MTTSDNDEQRRIDEDTRRVRNWRRWGPYLAERQWGTVREDYSEWGACWDYFPHDHARSRVYRWGEDGLLGICDRQCRVCFAIALWNGKDPILKERFFGLTGSEGNHSEDVKELYYYVDATPTSSYLKALYKYPQDAFPYGKLVDENRRRTKSDREYEIEDTGCFDRGYWDVVVEYAKDAPDDILIKLAVTNRGPSAALVHLLPTVWLRNTWAWNRSGEGYDAKGSIERVGASAVRVSQPTLGHYRLDADGHPDWLFTDNENNSERLWGSPGARYSKDAFHRRVVEGDTHAVNAAGTGTKCAAWYQLAVAAGKSQVVRLRLGAETHARAPFVGFDDVVARRIAEANQYHGNVRAAPLDPEERRLVRQADAGLVWSRKFYHYIVEHWREGDPGHPAPPEQRKHGRNRGWDNLWARDVIAMPDAWEDPWVAAWDLAFHCVAMARFDPQFAKQQMLLLCREWYMHANGQLPAYEFAFGDVNPPVHAWGVWRVYQLAADKDREFLERAFDKLLVNFTWWVNREDSEGDNLFTGGFLGLDNVGVFDRGQPLPGGGTLVQADATAWMAFYCTTMIQMAVELAQAEPHYGDLALKFFEHFVAIAKACNELGGIGLWDDTDGFYYDQMRNAHGSQMLKIRSLVGIVPLFAAASLDDDLLRQLPELHERIQWFFANRPQLAKTITCSLDATNQQRLLAIPDRERLARVLRVMLDENELLSPYGIRSVSKAHGEHPYVLELAGNRYEIRYAPGESTTTSFGGNSNWRGPVWFPMNYLLVEALKRYHHFYGDAFTVECPAGSGVTKNLAEVAEDLERRLVTLFLPDARGHRPCHGGAARYADDPAFKDLILFYEYFDGDTGRGCGASHQSGWTALAANIMERVAIARLGKQ
jgi:hypothetical protein